jgi:peptidoglycan/LPS O-acetylase OafA/YrhL
MDGYLPFSIYPLGLTGISVFGLIFVSGAVLEYNYKRIEHFSQYSRFLFKRFIRLYPAFWMSLLLGILLSPSLLQNGLFSTCMEFTGFFIVLGQGPGFLNSMGWFIGTIFLLYMLFPWFSRVISKYRLGAVIGFCILSWGLRFLLLTYNLVPLDRFYMWFPLCNAFEFCLGIYIIQAGLYPKKENNYPIVRILSDLSFYVFLFHNIITDAFFLDARNQGPFYNFIFVLGMHTTELGYPLWYLGVTVVILLVSMTAMVIDGRIQKIILKNEKVRQFLKG